MESAIACKGSLYIGSCGCTFDKETDWIVEVGEFCKDHEWMKRVKRQKKDKDTTIPLPLA